MNTWTRLIGWLSFGLLIIASFILVLRYVEKAPFFYLGLETCFVLLFISYKSKQHNFLKALFFNMAIIVLFFGLAEAYFTWFKAPITRGQAETNEEYLRGKNYYVLDAVRGYAAEPNVKKRVRKSFGKKVIYDVIYTINSDGLRVAPHDLAQNHEELLKKDYKNAIFFGGSFAFGEGVNDDETLPYFFEELSGGRYKAYNFGFHGYGAQQMLRIIETCLMERIVPIQKPMVVIYEALLYHIERVTGKMIWWASVPRYKLSPSGMLEYAGTFADDPNLKKNLERSKEVHNPKSQLLTRLMAAHRTPEDIELFVQIVLRSKNLLEKKYKSKFYVLVWPLGDKDAKKVVTELKKGGINVIKVDQVFKDPFVNYLIEGDYHPTKFANEQLAKYLLKYIK
jgi:hypothetical protein